VRFRPAADLTPQAPAAVAAQVRVRVLRWFARSGLIEPDDVHEMLAWENSGFSLDAAVRVGAYDRAGVERLLRFCARPPFSLERLELLDAERADYQLPKRQRNRVTALTLTARDLIDHLAALILPQGIRRGWRRRNGDSVKYFDPPGGRLPALSRPEQIHARGPLRWPVGALDGANATGCNASFAVVQEVSLGRPVSALSGSWESMGRESKRRSIGVSLSTRKP
jgi:hypothetical protein